MIIRPATPETHIKSPEILWDTYGIPHIYAANHPELFYAFGWAQMQSHGNLLLRLYGQARGRGAEYWGETYLEGDRWIHTMGVPRRAQDWYRAQTPEFRTYLDAFAAGINAYAEQQGDRLDEAVKVVLPVSGVDILAHLQQVLNFTFVVNPEKIKELLPTPEETPGSNAWAIAPARSQSGHTLLLINPHLPWSDPYHWYEAQLNAPGINASGVALVGIPVLSMAFNDNLGWAHTVNPHKGWDLYEVTVENEGYRFDGEVRKFEAQEQTLWVKQEDGSLSEYPLRVKHSIQGPIIEESEGKAIALRVVGLDAPGALQEWWNMATATELTDFEAALQPLQIPMFNIIYGDSQGHILHLYNGQVPVREGGTFEDGFQILPGDTSATLWTEIHPYQDLPRLLDPPTGWLQNANDPPWSTTFPRAIAPEDYPSYIAPSEMSFRAQRSVRMIAEQEKISFQKLIEYKHSTRMELADRILDDLIAAAKESQSSVAHQAAEVLSRWDRHANADSRGAVLFAFWVTEMELSELFVIPWNPDAPLDTPTELANSDRAVEVLEAVATEISDRIGSLDVPWGDIFRFRLDEIDLPANGGYGFLGLFRNIWFDEAEDGRFEAIGGDSYIAAIEFSPSVRAQAVLSYGNSSQPNSPHRTDQLELFATQQLRPVWRSRTEILSHLEYQETLKFTP
ncbi:acylase [Oscillatoria acuminata]|uniref:Penicilin amidase n=1 Tax=Oscillatoria acuminata PCC 6304 TaxID=56110 RepID=K9TL21_9CYAN|nr:acylase [Oscillatoria acuminata]AFY82821.1 penicilin amidase [Oscillatoria acuminata PCC 6304]